MKNVCFITVLSVRHARNNERVARRREKFAFYHSFERSTRTKSREGCQGQPKNSRFTSVLDVRHVRSDERVARAGAWIRILPQFWASDTSEVTKGSRGDVKNLRFTTVLSVRHVWSDERVDRHGKKLAFYLSFERPTRTKWREGCQIHRCDPCAQAEKEYILRLFPEDFTRFWLGVFLCSLFSSPFL